MNELSLIHPSARRKDKSFKCFYTTGWNIHICCWGILPGSSDVRRQTLVMKMSLIFRPPRRDGSHCCDFPEVKERKKIKAQSLVILGISRVETNNLVFFTILLLRVPRLIFADLFTPAVVIRMTYSWAGVRPQHLLKTLCLLFHPADHSLISRRPCAHFKTWEYACGDVKLLSVQPKGADNSEREQFG